METKELKIIPPEGFEIDKENSTFKCIKFKPIKRWRDTDFLVEGYYIISSDIYQIRDSTWSYNKNAFATKKQAKSALAMAQISQIMANDKRFGGVVTDEEFEDGDVCIYSINRDRGKVSLYYGTRGIDHFLSFHTEEQRDLFLKENEDLIKDYLMLD